MQQPLLLAALLSTACAGFAQGTHAPSLVVVNQTSHNVSFIDPASGRQTSTLDVAAITGHELAITPDGTRAFVPIYGNSGVGKSGSDGRSITVIDLSSHKIVGTINFTHGVRPHCAVYDPHRNLLYVTTELDQTITIIDPRTLKVVGTIPTGQAQSHMLALSHDGRFGYTANVGPGTVSVLDIQTRKTVTIIPIAAETQRISISNDDHTVFTADQTKPQLAVIDTATNKLKTWISLPAIAYGTASTPDGHWLLAAMRTTHQVAVIDLKALKVARTIDVPDTPTEIIIRPDGKAAYISCGSKVAVIDLLTWTATASMDAGQGADGLAWVQ